jgi:hypothetical protein
MGSSTHWSEKYPSRAHTAEIIWFPLIENVEEGYGGLVVGIGEEGGGKELENLSSLRESHFLV